MNVSSSGTDGSPERERTAPIVQAASAAVAMAYAPSGASSRRARPAAIRRSEGRPARRTAQPIRASSVDGGSGRAGGQFPLPPHVPNEDGRPQSPMLAEEHAALAGQPVLEAFGSQS